MVPIRQMSVIMTWGSSLRYGRVAGTTEHKADIFGSDTVVVMSTSVLSKSLQEELEDQTAS